MSIKRLLYLLLAITFLKGIVFSVIVPIWEFPDEQAHFPQVSYFVETGSPIGRGNDLSKEIHETQKALGTVRDDFGRNNYTYNPLFRPAYSSNLSGIYETYLENLPVESRSEYLKKEAARYPPIFYHLSSLGYRLAYEGDIFDRVFFSRLISVLIHVVSVWSVYQIGKLLFKNKSISLSFAAFVAFHPMYSFVSSGINNDNLNNLWSILLIWICVHLYKHGVEWKHMLLIGLVSGLALMTKPLIAPLLLAVGCALLLEWAISRRSLAKQMSLFLPLLVVGSIAGGWKYLEPLLTKGKLPFLASYKPNSGQQDLTFIAYLIPQLQKYYRETFVWYWGIFKWLGVFIPFWVIRIIKVSFIIAGLGLVKIVWKGKQLLARRQVLLMLILTFVFAGSLTLWDYDQMRKNGFSHGLQGRYFFPTLVAHMTLLYGGILALLKEKWQPVASVTLVTGMIVTHLVSLRTIVIAYYDVASIKVLFTQMSQYKPEYLKYPNSVVIISLYLVLLCVFVFLGYKQALVTNQKKSV